MDIDHYVHIDSYKINKVVRKAKDWALINGPVLPTVASDNPEVVTYSSFNLFPSPVPLLPFKKMKKVQFDFNLLIYYVGRDYDFLKCALKSAVDVDNFTSSLFNIYQKVHQEGIKDRGTLEILRNDYMLESRGTDLKFKQVEINTIAVGLACTATTMPSLHRYTLDLIGEHTKAQKVLDSASGIGTATALVRAWEVYDEPSAAILLVSEYDDRGQLAHRVIEYHVQKINRNVPFIRANLHDIGSRAVLTDDSQLKIDGYEIGVVYYRTGYRPEYYKTHVEWNGRLLAERSCAIKCPTIGSHLAGSKIIQQKLSEPGIIERYIDDPEIVNQIRDTFCDQYSLHPGPGGDHAIALAMQNPEKFVLKPNREGGGNNFFGEDIREKLTELRNSSERAAYILMERIEPVVITGYPVWQHKPVTLQKMSYELGIYGVLVSDDKGIVMNEEIGHVLRTKEADVTEAGTSFGASVVDTPLLVEDIDFINGNTLF